MTRALGRHEPLHQPGCVPGLIIEDDVIDVLDRIADPTVGLALWRRDPPAALSRWLDDLPPEQLPDGRALIRPGDLDEAMAAIFKASSTPDIAIAHLLAADIAALVRRFAEIAATDLIDLRLEALRDDGCSKFHRDFVPLRLITTYRGPGTQWVAPIDAEQAAREQENYAGALRHMPRCAVALFKGEGHGMGHGIVHRSPPIEGTGISRLLLVLNLPSAASPKPWQDFPYCVQR